MRLVSSSCENGTGHLCWALTCVPTSASCLRNATRIVEPATSHQYKEAGWSKEKKIEGEKWERWSRYFTHGCEKRVKYNFPEPERCAKPSLDSSS